MTTPTATKIFCLSAGYGSGMTTTTRKKVTQAQAEMNETTDWWVALLAAKTAEAQTYANHNFRSIEKREIFMSAFHWTMVNARPEIFAALDRG